MRYTRLPLSSEYEQAREDLRVAESYQVHPRMADDVEQRGIDMLSPVWNLLDLTPTGRPDEWYPTIDY